MHWCIFRFLTSSLLGLLAKIKYKFLASCPWSYIYESRISELYSSLIFNCLRNLCNFFCNDWEKLYSNYRSAPFSLQLKKDCCLLCISYSHPNSCEVIPHFCYDIEHFLIFWWSFLCLWKTIQFLHPFLNWVIYYYTTKLQKMYAYFRYKHLMSIWFVNIFSIS